MSDELDRLAAADPVPGLPAAGPPPDVTGPPGRGHRTRSRLFGAAAVLALGGVIAALVVAAPSGDDDDRPPAARPLTVALLDRPGPPAAVAPLPARIDAATVRVAARSAGVVWYAARPVGRPGIVCLLSLGNDDRVVLHRCAPIARGLVAGARRDGARFRVAGVVPDGIDAVTIGPRTAPVRGNAFTLTTKRAPDVVVLQGRAAPHIPRRPDVAVALRGGRQGVVAVGFAPDPEVDAPLGRPGTLRAAAAAVPFTVLAPDPPPRGVPIVRWAAAVPGIPARVEVAYLRTSGRGITLVERLAAPGTPDMAPVITRDMPDGAIVRTVRAGTVAEVRGPNDRLDDLLAVAASLRPVAP